MMRSMVESFNVLMPKPLPGRSVKGVFGLTRERKLQKELREDVRMSQNEKRVKKEQIEKIRIERKKKDVEKVYKKIEESDSEIYKLVDSLKEKSAGIPNRMKIGDETYTGDAVRKAIIQYYQQQGDQENDIFHQGFDQAEFYCPEMMIARFTILFKNKNSKMDLDNYRAIKISTVTGRIIQRIILRRHFSHWVNKLMIASMASSLERIMSNPSVM